MKKQFCAIMFFALFGWASAFTASAQSSCASVTLQPTAASNTAVTAQVSATDCRPDNSHGFFDASVTATTNNNAAVRFGQNPSPLGLSGTGGMNILPQVVTQCTSVNITFTMKFKLKTGSEEVPGREQTQTVTKTLVVCPVEFDPQVTSFSTTPAAAGQQSQVTVTIANQGAQTLFSSSYNLVLALVESMTGLVRNTCSSGGPTIVDSVDLPAEIKAGETRTATVRIRFPQAGALNLRATATLNGAEDGPTSNNVRTQAVTVPLPRPLVCEVQPLTTTPGAVVTIRGNWFKVFGESTKPTVRFSNVAVPDADVTVVSPLEMTVRMPNLACTAVGRVSVRVTNATGETTFAGGPTFPDGLTIAGTTPAPGQLCPGSLVTINLSGLRANCPDPTVRLGNLVLAVQTRTNTSITVQLPPTVTAHPTTLAVETPYGTDSVDTFPALSITGLSRDLSPPGTAENLVINLTNFRPDCNVSVELEPIAGTPGNTSSAQILSRTANTIVARASVPIMISIYRVKVITDYGTASGTLKIVPPESLPPTLGVRPEITSAAPNPVFRGQPLVIFVDHLPINPNMNVTVTLSGMTLPLQQRQNNLLVVVIPPAIPEGQHTLKVTTSFGSDERIIAVRSTP